MRENNEQCTLGQTDYRISHIGKGRSYDNSFRENPWRAFLWQREQCVLDYVLKQYFSNNSIRHLDFACGTGRILKYLVGRTETSTGIDVSESMLEVTRKTVPNAEIIKADVTRNDVLGNRKFNLITAFRFFPNAQPALRAETIKCLSKHLVPDGLLVFNNHKNHSSTLYQVTRLLGKYHRTMSTRDTGMLVWSADLHVIKVFPIGVLPANDRFMIVPHLIHTFSDWIANSCRIGKFLAQNLIFVCRPQATN